MQAEIIIYIYIYVEDSHEVNCRVKILDFKEIRHWLNRHKGEGNYDTV